MTDIKSANARVADLATLADARGIRLEQIREVLQRAGFACVFGEDETEVGCPQILDGVKYLAAALAAKEARIAELEELLASVTAERDSVQANYDAYRRQTENALGMPVDTRDAYTPGVSISNLRNEHAAIRSALHAARELLREARPHIANACDTVQSMRPMLARIDAVVKG